MAGPVVTAAICLLPHARPVPGVVDSKKITCETRRNDLYQKLVAIPNVSWAVAIIDAHTIDAINIIQATLLGMRLAASVVLGQPIAYDIIPTAMASIAGCYVMLGGGDGPHPPQPDGVPTASDDTNSNNIDRVVPDRKETSYYALIDGNRVPDDMPCPSQAVVKGDGRDYCIAAAYQVYYTKVRQANRTTSEPNVILHLHLLGL